MAALKMTGDWLQGSVLVQALVQAEITSAGTADSFLRASHVSQEGTSGYSSSTVDAALHRQAYDHYLELSDERDEELEFDDWCQQQTKTCPQFDHWATVLQLELTVLVYVCSPCQGSFQMYEVVEV